MHFDESVTKDECGNSWTASDSLTLSTDTKKFGTSSLYINASNSLLLNNLNLVSTEYTISYWLFEINNTGGKRYVEWIGTNRNCHRGDLFEYNGGTKTISSTQPLNEWTHMAIVNTADNLIIFRNGVKLGTFPSSPNITKISIGYNLYSSKVDSCEFYIDDLQL